MADIDIKPGQLTGDKSARSVFVGNIPYEATEEKLKEIFSEVGTVLSFKLVYDRENGKPRGYGFCEYMNPEIALCAMRNLNGYEIGGRTLRVDSACTEKNQMMQALGGNAGAMGSSNPTQSAVAAAAGLGPGDNGPYGEAVEPEKAPEAISKAVASLPPEQMFELMKQMKMCIQNNPQEARNMLLQNPQLAYALLQAQVVMRIVDPEMALQMLHKSSSKPLSVGARGEPMQRTGSIGGPGPMSVPAPSSTSQSNMLGQMGPGQFSSGQAGMRPEGTFGQGFGMPGDVGFDRDLDQRNPAVHGMPQNRDPRGLTIDDSQRFGGRDPRSRDPRAGGDPRVDRSNFDPRSANNSQINNRGQMPMPNTSMSSQNINAPGSNPIQLPPHLANADPSRTQLIMQVLQLTDEQIAMLPTEQRLSIMELKKQIANNK